MMKKLAMVVAVVFALICSQACAQKKTESSSASKAQASPKGSPVSISRAVESKKAKESKSETESGKSKSAKKDSTAKAEGKEAEAVTDEQQKQIKSMLRQTLKAFSGAELTDEQRTKADEVFGKAVRDYVIKRARAMITDELQKEHDAAMKEAKSSSKSAREQAKAAFTTAGFSEDQIKVFKATQTSLNKAKREFGKTLSDKQIDCLPEQLQSLIRD